MKLYGLIGYPLSHSFSRKYFTEKFAAEHIEGCEYRNFELPSILEVPDMIAGHPSLQGFNITIPYKEQIIPYLHAKNSVVEKIGACNCVRIVNGQLTGFNTDVTGFEESLKRGGLKPHHNRALVLGTGGAAKAVAFVLDRLGIPFSFVSRSTSGNRHLLYAELTPDVIGAHTLIINTSPTGMYPNTGEAPALPYEALTPLHYLFDLVYNPEKTLFLRNGEEQGATIKNGHDMLIIQAEESWKIWNADPGALF